MNLLIIGICLLCVCVYVCMCVCVCVRKSIGFVKDWSVLYWCMYVHMFIHPAKSRCSEEKNKVDELKRTWQLANDHFIVSQDKLKQEIYRLQQKLERGDSAR